MTAEIVYNLSIEDYHSGKGISKSLLDEAHRSVAHYLARLKEPEAPTPAMVIGSAAHALILEGEAAFKPFLEMPEFRQSTKTGQKALASVKGMAAAFAAHPTAPRIIEDGEPEVSLFWDDAETGLLLKARPDSLRTDGDVMDLKTTQDARPEEFARSIYNFRYHAQAAMIEDGCKANGLPFENFLIIAIEKEPPYCLSIFRLLPEAIKAGRQAYKEDLQAILAYQNKVELWTGYPYAVQNVGLPAWAIRKEGVCYGG